MPGQTSDPAYTELLNRSVSREADLFALNLKNQKLLTSAEYLMQKAGVVRVGRTTCSVPPVPNGFIRLAIGADEHYQIRRPTDLSDDIPILGMTRAVIFDPYEFPRNENIASVNYYLRQYTGRAEIDKQLNTRLDKIISSQDYGLWALESFHVFDTQLNIWARELGAVASAHNVSLPI